MKKALITVILTILLSAGILFSAGNLNILAAETEDHVYIESLVVSGSDVFFEVENADIVQVILEYSYYKENILFSKLERLNVQKVSLNTTTGFSKYHFTKPSSALSMKIWRISNSNTISSTSNGEYIYSEDTALSQVQARVKQIIVDNDLITKEGSYSDNIAALAYTFVMHFDLIDEEGNPIDIDRIIRLSVKFDVIQTGLISTTTSKSIVIEETTFYSTSYFPYFIPQFVTQNIDQSFDPNYTWMVNLGTYKSGAHIPIIAPGDVTIDKTQLLTIDYVFEGVFYDNQVVIDEPYDKDDIITVNPGTTDPYTSIWEKLNSIFDNLDSAINIIILVVTGLAAVLVLSLISKAFKFVALIGKILIGLINYTLKLIKFIMVDIPGYLIKFILFLIVPREKRKEHLDASRYL